MKKRLVFLTLGFFVCVVNLTAAANDEVTLFDKDGNPVAYIDTADNYLPIYLWDGTPAAYLFNNRIDFDVYGFNGKHLGWYVGGVIRDHDGNVIGARKDAFSGLTRFEPLKSLKKLKPLQQLRQLSPLRPLMTIYWSNENFRMFLLGGI
jgi:hypothetical protein